MVDKLEVGMKLHALHSDGEFYPAEVLEVSKEAIHADAPVKVSFSERADAPSWLGIDKLKSKHLNADSSKLRALSMPLSSDISLSPPDMAMCPTSSLNALANSQEKVYDYSGIEAGMRVQAEKGGVYFGAEVLEVDLSGKTPIKVRFIGHDSMNPEWVGGDRLRSKALKTKNQPAVKSRVQEIENLKETFKRAPSGPARPRVGTAPSPRNSPRAAVKDDRPPEAVAGKGIFGGWLKKSKHGVASKLMKKTQNYFALNFDTRHWTRSKEQGKADKCRMTDQSDIAEEVPFADLVDVQLESGSCFWVRTTHRSYQLYADSPQGATTWVAAVRAAQELGPVAITEDIQESLEVERLEDNTLNRRGSAKRQTLVQEIAECVRKQTEQDPLRKGTEDPATESDSSASSSGEQGGISSELSGIIAQEEKSRNGNQRGSVRTTITKRQSIPALKVTVVEPPGTAPIGAVGPPSPGWTEAGEKDAGLADELAEARAEIKRLREQNERLTTDVNELKETLSDKDEERETEFEEKSRLQEQHTAMEMDLVESIRLRESEQRAKEVLESELKKSQTAQIEKEGGGSEGRLRVLMTTNNVTTVELKSAIGAVEAMVGEARRELERAEFREKRAAYEALFAAIDKKDEKLIEAALVVGEKVGLDESDMEKGQNKLTELRSMTDEQKDAKAAKQIEVKRKKEAFVLIKKNDEALFAAFLDGLEETVKWMDWRDYAGRTLLKVSQDLRADNVQTLLESRLGLSAPESALKPPSRDRVRTGTVTFSDKVATVVNIPVISDDSPVRTTSSASNATQKSEVFDGSQSVTSVQSGELDGEVSVVGPLFTPPPGYVGRPRSSSANIRVSQSGEALKFNKDSTQSLQVGGLQVRRPSQVHRQSSLQVRRVSSINPRASVSGVQNFLALNPNLAKRLTVARPSMAVDSALAGWWGENFKMAEVGKDGSDSESESESEEESEADAENALSEEEIEELKKKAFRCCVQNKAEDLEEVLDTPGLSQKVWEAWTNKGGKDLLTLCEERGSSDAQAALLKAMGLVEELKRDAFEEREDVWVYLQGDVQPRRATVMEDTSEEPDEILIEYWDGFEDASYVARACVRKCEHAYA